MTTNKKRIKWERLKNPLLNVDEDGEVNTEGKVMVQVTPFGAAGYKLNPEFPSEQAYVGHTNFDIDADVKRIIEQVEGVEVLTVISPYRMRLIVGKAFNGRKVRRKITETLCGAENDYTSIEDDTELYKESLRLQRQDKPWALYVLPNGRYESVLADTEKELEQKLNKYLYIKNQIGGIILSP